MTDALLLAAGIPLGYSLEGLAGSVLYLRSRYDLRAVLLAWSMGHRWVIVLASVVVAGELQVGVSHVVQCVQRFVGFIVLLRDRGRAAVGRHRVAPRADAGEDVRGHVQRVWRVRGDVRGSLAPLLLGG
jgi:hypothetical protein